MMCLGDLRDIPIVRKAGGDSVLLDRDCGKSDFLIVLLCMPVILKTGMTVRYSDYGYEQYAVFRTRGCIAELRTEEDVLDDPCVRGVNLMRKISDILPGTLFMTDKRPEYINCNDIFDRLNCNDIFDGLVCDS